MDCHPVPRPASIEVRTSGGSTRAGQLDYTSEFTQTIANAEGALASLGREKVLERQRSVEYNFLIHFESFAEWQEYYEYWAGYYDPLPEGLMQNIEELAGVTGAEIVLDIECEITTFKKPG